MNNFQFYNPTTIFFGKGEIAKIASELHEGAKVLMTYGGGSIFRNGVHEQVRDAVKGFDVIEFGGIEPNPRYETLMQAVELARNERVSFLLAVGGGSVIDGTKFIAAAIHYNGDPWEILTKGGKAVERATPLGVVLTLPATGSEMNGNAVITRWATREKLAFGSSLVMPEFSVLDPETIYSLPDKQISNGIVDAFIHVMEQYLTYPVDSPVQDRFAESILLTLIDEGPKVLADKTSYEAAANFMWAATMALNGLIGAGVPQDWSTHMIGHELTAFHGIDHGQTLAVVLPGVMHVKRDNKREKLLQYGERIWGIKSGSKDARIDKVIQQTVDFFESLNVKTRLSDYEVGEPTIEKICRRFEERGLTAIGEQRDTTVEEIRMILASRL